MLRRPQGGADARSAVYRKAATMDVNGLSNQPPPGVVDAIRGAANATGVSFDYLLAAARAESNLNPQAAAATSSARGLYQFIDQTWLAVMKRSGASLGYGTYADAITQTAGGRYEVADPAIRRAVMALREDPVANAALAGALTTQNAVELAGRLGRAPSGSELYTAHVLGAAGAARLTALLAASPGAPAALFFPAAAEANRAVFVDRQGQARSVADVYGILGARYAGIRAALSAAPSDSTAGPGAPLGLPSAPVGLAPLSLPGLSSGFPTRAASSGTATAGEAVVTAPGAAVGPEPKVSSLFAGLFGDGPGTAAQFVAGAYAAQSPLPLVSPSSGASLVSAAKSRPMFQAQRDTGWFGR